MDSCLLRAASGLSKEVDGRVSTDGCAGMARSAGVPVPGCGWAGVAGCACPAPVCGKLVELVEGVDVAFLAGVAEAAPVPTPGEG